MRRARRSLKPSAKMPRNRSSPGSLTLLVRRCTVTIISSMQLTEVRDTETFISVTGPNGSGKGNLVDSVLAKRKYGLSSSPPFSRTRG